MTTGSSTSQATSSTTTTPLASHTLVPTDAPAINSQPVELDASACVSAEEVSRRRRGSEMGVVAGGRRGSEV